MIEAYLYAQDTIGGLARRNSYRINGGIIADNYRVVSGAPGCQTKTDIHPVHKQPVAWSYLNYDRRMKYGLPLLDKFSDFCVANPDRAPPPAASSDVERERRELRVPVVEVLVLGPLEPADKLVGEWRRQDLPHHLHDVVGAHDL